MQTPWLQPPSTRLGPKLATRVPSLMGCCLWIWGTGRCSVVPSLSGWQLRLVSTCVAVPMRCLFSLVPLGPQDTLMGEGHLPPHNTTPHRITIHHAVLHHIDACVETLDAAVMSLL